MARIQTQRRRGASHSAMNKRPAAGQTIVSASALSCSTKPIHTAIRYSAAKAAKETAPFAYPWRMKSHSRPDCRSGAIGAVGVGTIGPPCIDVIVRLFLVILQKRNGH